MCGASVSSDAPQCRYCEAKLATVSCPKCFGMIFIGSKHCQRCGAATTTPTEKDIKGKNCPRCRTQMQLVSVGETSLIECAKCMGLWLDVETFERICADREQQTAFLGTASLAGSVAV